MDEQRVAEAGKIILPSETKERLQNSIAEGYYFAFDTHFLVQQHQVMKYLLLADNREIFLSKRVYEELDSKETILILNKFSNENRLNIIIQEPDQPFLRSHRFIRKHDDLIVASYLHYMLSKEKKILLCTNDVGIKMLATSVEIPVFTC